MSYPFVVSRRIAGALVLAALALVASAWPAPARELARVRVSQFAGDEPAELDSESRPDLFVLDPAVVAVRLLAVNVAAPSKLDFGPARWLPDLTPGSEAGLIALEVTVRPGESVAPSAVRFTTAALFPSNPSSLVVRTSFDDLQSVLAVIDLATTSSRRVSLPSPPSDHDFTVFWIAGNDFGDFGGGPAGFVNDDVVVLGDGDACPQAPASGCFEPGQASVRLAKGKDEVLAWSWANGTTSAADFGDPTKTTEYALCLYDDDRLVGTSVIPAASKCGAKPCWRTVRRGGFSYADRAGRNAGITGVTLDPGVGDAAVTVNGSGSNLALPLPIIASQRMTVQLRRTDGGGCWSSAFAAPARTSSAVEFKDVLP